MTHEQRQALEMLANSSRGIGEAVLATRGLAGDLLAGLVRDGLASVASETLWTDGQPVEVIRVQITDSGRRRSTSPLPAVQPTISGRSDLRFAICAQ